MADPIKHVVLLMLENASCDRYFGYLSDTGGPYPYPQFDGINPAEKRWNQDAQNKKYYQEPTKLKQMRLDPAHEMSNIARQLFDNNSGFVLDLEQQFAHKDAEVLEECKQNVMGYYPRGFLPAHHTLGENYTVCDRWFCSVPGPTWPNRMFALSGHSNGFVNMPQEGNFWKSCTMLFAQFQPTLLTRLYEAGRSFKVYFHDYPCSLILTRHLDNIILRHYDPIADFYEATKGKESDFPEFTFIEPKYYGGDQNDDHPPHSSLKAQRLVAKVYNAIRANEELWKSTLLVVLHDEHGGFYDHVIPPKGAVVPQENAPGTEFDFQQLGFRIPAIIVSPYAPRGVEHTEFDHTSLLKYLKDKWKLGDLGKRVDAANSLAVALNFSAPRADCIGLILEPTDKEVEAEYPELENEVNPHHYAYALFKKLAPHSFAVGALVALTKRFPKAGSFSEWWRFTKPEVWKIFWIFFLELVKDYAARTEDMKKGLQAQRDGAIENLIAKAKAEVILK